MAFGRWIISEQDKNAIAALCEALSVTELTAQVLLARGHATPELAREFLESGGEFESPFALKDIDIAAARMNQAIENEERIAIFGDYDVDGITSTALMWMYLQGCGADVVCSLPTRESSGYGLSNEAVDNLRAYDVSLIVTVDNGVSAYHEIAYANSLGLDVIVCDHHLPPEKLPDAVAVVNPLRHDDESRFKDLAGVGVALKLAAAVEGCGVRELLDMYGYLVALGTVSDIMPLRGENRAIVKEGLAQLQMSDNPGLAALCEESGIDLQTITAANIAFGLAPRLNAAGRMDNADIALQLLITDDVEEAQAIAQQLADLNTSRRDTEADIIQRVNREIQNDPTILRQPIIVIAGEDLHAGVTGIVCSRLVERYGKPVVIISIEGGDAKGSGRSIDGFSLHEAIASCADMLVKYGGHDMAAGFTIDAKDVDKLKRALYAYCRELETGMPCPVFSVDALVDVRAVTLQAVEELEMLAPFGNANAEPVFAIQNAAVADIAPLNQNHSRITLRQNGASLSGVVFGKTPAMLPFQQGDIVDAGFMLSVYRGGARDMVSVRFRDIRIAGVGDDAFASLQAYNNLCAGRMLTQEERGWIAPSRDDVAAVYRSLNKQALEMTDLVAVSYRLRELPLGKTLAIVEILEQLGLVDIQPDGDGGIVASTVANAPKRSLTDSILFTTLHEEKIHDVSAT